LQVSQGESVVKLLPACRVEVALSSEESIQMQDREILVSSRGRRNAPADSQPPQQIIRPWGGQAQLRSDADGRASAIVPERDVTVTVVPLPGAHYFDERMTIRAQSDQTVRLPIALKPGIQVIGHVQTADGDPVAGVEVSIVGVNSISSDEGILLGWITA